LTQKRKKLIFFVNEKSYSIGKAASRLKIKLSTAKMIVKRFNTHGTFFQPKPIHPLKPKQEGEAPEHSSEGMEGGEGEEEVKVEVEEEVEAVAEEMRVKVEEREEGGEPAFGWSTDMAALPSFGSWSVLVGDYPYYFDGYTIHPYPTILQPLFLS
jgi:transposase